MVGAAVEAQAAGAFAPGQEAALFEGLILGEPVDPEELDWFYGRGISVNFNLADGTEFNLEDLQFGNNGSTINSADSSTLTNDSVLTGNSGIFQNIPVIGDGNQVVVNVVITVNMNTVTIADSSGASILVNQTLDFGGSISALGQ